MILPIQHISVSIEASPTLVYGYAAKPQNLPNWASGLSSGISFEDGTWVSHSPMGRVEVVFVPENALGVLDHYVTLPNGQRFLNPLRVLSNGDGSEVVFTAFQQSDMSTEDFARDVQLIREDLERLKALLETAKVSA